MNDLNINNEFLLLDFKMYHPNLLTNDEFIDRHQQFHRDYKVSFPKKSSNQDNYHNKEIKQE